MKKLFALVGSFGLVLNSGCLEPYVEVDSSPIAAVQRDYILVFVLDTSGSFSHKMFGGDKIGYKFFLRASDQYFRNRMGEHDRIIISQLSAEDRSLLWEGPPLTLRRQFGTASSLQQHIEEKSNPNGSRVYAAVTNAIEYVLGLPGVRGGETEVCVCVLSDMLDNAPTQEEDKQRMRDALKQFAQIDGSIGLYWVDQSELKDWREMLGDSEVRDWVVEADIVVDPKMPYSEQ